MTRPANSGWVLMPVPTAVPPRATGVSSSRAYARRLSPASIWSAYPRNTCPNRIGVASWRWVRPILITFQVSRDFAISSSRSERTAGSSTSSSARSADTCIAVGITSLLDWPEVDVIVGVHRFARASRRRQDLRRPVRDHLVGVHVGRGARAGLKDIHDELAVVPSVRDFLGGLADRLGDPGIEQTEVAVRLRGRPLDQPESPHEPTRHPRPADREVEHRAPCRGTVVRLGRHLHLAHRIPLDPLAGFGHVKDLLAAAPRRR